MNHHLKHKAILFAEPMVVLTRKDFEELLEDAETARVGKLPGKLGKIRRRMEKGSFVTLEDLKLRLG